MTRWKASFLLLWTGLSWDQFWAVEAGLGMEEAGFYPVKKAVARYN